jgi:hypothetical protein
MPFTCAELFASLGNEWNRPNWQENAAPIIRTIERHGRVVDVELEYEIEGYTPVADAPRAALQPRDFVEPNPNPVRARPKIEMQARPWNPEYRPVRPVAHVPAPGEAQGLTPELEQLRKQQRAGEKARLTRAANKIAAKEAARLAAIEELRVKVSQDA